MRILWVGGLPQLQFSGYGNQALQFVPRLMARGHQVAIATLGAQGVGGLQWGDVPIYGPLVELLSQDVVARHARHFRADVILTLADTWALSPERYDGIPWIPWTPIDQTPRSPLLRWFVREGLKLEAAHTPIAMSRFGETLMRDAGLSPAYVPHGIDTRVYAPSDRHAARRALGWPTDAFIVGQVGLNHTAPGRKNFPEHLEAFARLRAKHRDAVLYLHTQRNDHREFGGVCIAALCEAFGLQLDRNVITCDTYQQLVLGYPAEHMAALYNAMDVLVSVTAGEGFGIPIVEAQACGTPVIVGGWTAMPELCFAGWTVPQEESHPLWSPLGGFYYLPRVGAIAERLEWAYKKAGDERLREQARTGALAYDADTVADTYWRPALDDIEAQLQKRAA